MCPHPFFSTCSVRPWGTLKHGPAEFIDGGWFPRSEKKVLRANSRRGNIRRVNSFITIVLFAFTDYGCYTAATKRSCAFKVSGVARQAVVARFHRRPAGPRGLPVAATGVDRRYDRLRIRAEAAHPATRTASDASAP